MQPAALTETLGYGGHAMSLRNPTFRRQTHRLEVQDDSPVLEWPSAPDAIRLTPGQVHLWAAALHEFLDQVPKLELVLSHDELARAGKFHFVEDCNRYMIRHALLRLILSPYLEQRPSTIEFQHGAYGKPEVRRRSAARPVFFNTSHSSEIAVYAITLDCPVGVDVERTRQIPEIEDIASRFFLPRETRTLLALPASSRLQAFYSCWTRKEAFLKATGEGIAENLEKVEVTLAPEDQPEVVSLTGDPRARERWQLRPFSPAAGYLGCLAYRNETLAFSQWRVREIEHLLTRSS